MASTALKSEQVSQICSIIRSLHLLPKDNKQPWHMQLRIYVKWVASLNYYVVNFSDQRYICGKRIARPNHSNSSATFEYTCRLG